MGEVMVPGDGWVSDDSSYYGDEDDQDRLAVLNNHFSVKTYWTTPESRLDLNTIMAQAETKPSTPPAELFNPYQDHQTAWQLGESITDFVRRLPPVTTTTSLGDWIWVCNPHRDKQGSFGEKSGDLIERGRGLLADYLEVQRKIESENNGRAKATITRRISQEREHLKERINDLAKETKTTSGKWMLFPSLEDLPRIWRLIAEGVVDNRLGTSAKVAPDDGTPSAQTRLICVYTKSFFDTKDVLRVLEELVAIGVVDVGTRPIYYKTDAYTLLDIYRENPYGLKASLYSSKDMLASANFPIPQSGTVKRQSTLDSFRQHGTDTGRS